MADGIKVPSRKIKESGVMRKSYFRQAVREGFYEELLLEKELG